MADISVTAGNVAEYANGQTAWGTAGETITAGQTLYLNSTTGKLMKADADTAAESVCKGIALNGGSLNQPIKYIYGGEYTAGGTVAVGTVYVVSATAGGIAPLADLTSGDYVSILGVASTAARIKLNIFNSGIAVA